MADPVGAVVSGQAVRGVRVDDWTNPLSVSDLGDTGSGFDHSGDFRDKVAKEIISRFETQIANQKVFWTDANGRQMLKRT